MKGGHLSTDCVNLRHMGYPHQNPCRYQDTKARQS